MSRSDRTRAQANALMQRMLQETRSVEYGAHSERLLPSGLIMEFYDFVEDTARHGEASGVQSMLWEMTREATDNHLARNRHFQTLRRAASLVPDDGMLWMPCAIPLEFRFPNAQLLEHKKVPEQFTAKDPSSLPSLVRSCLSLPASVEVIASPQAVCPESWWLAPGYWGGPGRRRDFSECERRVNTRFNCCNATRDSNYPVNIVLRQLPVWLGVSLAEPENVLALQTVGLMRELEDGDKREEAAYENALLAEAFGYPQDDDNMAYHNLTRGNPCELALYQLMDLFNLQMEYAAIFARGAAKNNCEIRGLAFYEDVPGLPVDCMLFQLVAQDKKDGSTFRVGSFGQRREPDMTKTVAEVAEKLATKYDLVCDWTVTNRKQ